MKKLIVNGRLLLPEGIRKGSLLVEDGRIARVLPEGEEPWATGAEIIDADGLYVAPGFIDLHTHGAGGADFMDGTVEAYLTAARMHAQHGTTLLYPTTLTSTNELLYASFETYEKALSRCGVDGAAFGGMHLEGPFFNREMAGAQNPKYSGGIPGNPLPDPAHRALELRARTARLAGVRRRTPEAGHRPVHRPHQRHFRRL